MRTHTLLCTAVLVLMSQASAEEKQPEMSRYTAAYSGGEGYQVWITRYGPREKHEALVQISGIDHKLDGAIVRAKEEYSGNAIAYSAVVDGRNVELVKVEGGNAELNITGHPWKSRLCYDKALSADRPPLHMLTDYQQQPPMK